MLIFLPRSSHLRTSYHRGLLRRRCCRPSHRRASCQGEPPLSSQRRETKANRDSTWNLRSLARRTRLSLPSTTTPRSASSETPSPSLSRTAPFSTRWVSLLLHLAFSAQLMTDHLSTPRHRSTSTTPLDTSAAAPRESPSSTPSSRTTSPPTSRPTTSRSTFSSLSHLCG